MPSLARWRRILDRGMSALLFRYQAGLDPRYTFGGTFARASTATYLDASGIVRTAASGEPRYQHYDPANLSLGPLLLLEGSRTNSALGACYFSDTTYWAQNGNTLSAATSSAVSGQTATKHVRASGVSPNRTQDIGIFVNGQTDCLSWIVEQGAGTTTSEIAIYDQTAAAFVHRAQYTWATKAMVTAAGSGTSGAIDLGTGPNGGAMARLWVTATGTAAGTAAAGNTRRAVLYHFGLSASGTETATCHHAQFEANAKFPSSAIITTSAAVTRAADALSFPFLAPPQAMTVYADCVFLAAASTGTNFTVAHIGASVATKPYWKMRVDGAVTNKATVSFLDNNVDALTESVAATTPAFGVRVEHRSQVSSLATVISGASINSAAEVLGSAALAASGLPATWSATTLTVGNDAGGSAPAFLALRSLKVAAGVQTLATMRGA